MGTAGAPTESRTIDGRWEQDRVREWADRVPWSLGCNFVPSTAVNVLEMWQEDTFDLPTIDRELGWAADVGLNTVRIFLHDLLWREDRDGLMDRFDRVLDVAAGHDLMVMPVFLDGCWNNYAHLGPQPEPVPDVHNSQWVQSPQSKVIVDPTAWEPLRSYVQTIIDRHRDDERILLWDLYNEPGNEGILGNAIPLVEAAFTWAREVDPSHPLTVPIWNTHEDYAQINEVSLSASDVLTFHWYGDLADTLEVVDFITPRGRPMMCTEYMARTMQSRLSTHLPAFHERGVGALHWGHVRGRTQTHQPWTSTRGSGEPEEWFHDILEPDGTPYDEDEVALLRSLSPRRAAVDRTAS